MKHSPLTVDEIWDRVKAYATKAKEANRPIFTVVNRIENRIVEVSDNKIIRVSAAGTSNRSAVTKTMVKHLWNEIHGKSTGKYLVFTKALLLGAMPDILVGFDGDLVLRDATSTKRKKKRIRRA